VTTRLTMPQSVTRIASPGSLLKRQRGVLLPARRTATRLLDAGHLEAIRQLPCARCGMEPCGEAAHVRLNSSAFGKRQAIGQKPGDEWTVPLDRGCHQDDPDSQHRVGEAIFWDRVGINPLHLAKALYEASSDIPRMRAIVFTFIANRGSALTPGAEPLDPQGGADVHRPITRTAEPSRSEG
jgi:hypothetical protein